MRHNEIKDTTAALLTKVCSNVCVEPHLQLLSNEDLNGASALRDDSARLDIAVDGFWGARCQSLFSVYRAQLESVQRLRRVKRKTVRESGKWNTLHLHY